MLEPRNALRSLAAATFAIALFGTAQVAGHAVAMECAGIAFAVPVALRVAPGGLEAGLQVGVEVRLQEDQRTAPAPGLSGFFVRLRAQRIHGDGGHDGRVDPAREAQQHLLKPGLALLSGRHDLARGSF